MNRKKFYKTIVEPGICSVCRTQRSVYLCGTCLTSTCPECNEAEECVECRFRRLNRNTIVASSLALISLLLLVITLLLKPALTFTSFLTADLGVLSSLRSFYGVVHAFSSFTCVPYAFVVTAANTKRHTYLKKIDWSDRSTIYYIAIALVAIVAFSEVSYLVQCFIVQSGEIMAIIGAIADVLIAVILVRHHLGRFNPLISS